MRAPPIHVLSKAIPTHRSLQATWIRNSILHALKGFLPSIARQMPSTFVYDSPTIARLAEFVSDAARNGSSGPTRDVVAKRNELYTLVDKYSATFPSFNGHIQERTGNVVILTGGTGSLGANILAKLLEKPDITRVYAMSRPSSSGLSAKERHVMAFEREGLGVTLLESNKVRCLDGDAARPDFGIDPMLYQEVIDILSGETKRR